MVENKEAIAKEVRKRAKKLDDEPLRETLWLSSSMLKVCSAHGSDCSTCSAIYICAAVDCTSEIIWQELQERMDEALRAKQHEDWEE